MYRFLTLELPSYDENRNYHAEFWKMYITTHVQIAQLKQLEAQVNKFRDKLEASEKLEAAINEMKKLTCKKKNRRAAKDISKDFPCPYAGCFKAYGSDVSLNLHIKSVHNGGTKTERQHLAVKK